MVQRLTFAPRASVLRQLRAAVRRLAAGLGAGERVGDNLALVVDELVNNAIEHGAGYRQRDLDLALEVATEGEQLRLEFFDPEMPPETVGELAQMLTDAANGMPSLDSERGRGLFLLSVYMQGLHAEVAASGGLRLIGHIDRR
jgi:anti-sigma regulatory factor (Ser/Thr protein kinase)